MKEKCVWLKGLSVVEESEQEEVEGDDAWP